MHSLASCFESTDMFRIGQQVDVSQIKIWFLQQQCNACIFKRKRKKSMLQPTVNGGTVLRRTSKQSTDEERCRWIDILFSERVGSGSDVRYLSGNRRTVTIISTAVSSRKLRVCENTQPRGTVEIIAGGAPAVVARTAAILSSKNRWTSSASTVGKEYKRNED